MKKVFSFINVFVFFLIIPITATANFEVNHISNFNDWVSWKSPANNNSEYYAQGDKIDVTGDGYSGEVWNQFTKVYGGSIGISGTLNIESMSGCSQIGFRQFYESEDGGNYQYHFNVSSCYDVPIITIFYQKNDSNYNQIQREDFRYCGFETIGKDIKLSLFLYENKLWFYCNDTPLKTIKMPADAILSNERRDLKLWIQDGSDSFVEAQWKSIDIITNCTENEDTVLRYDDGHADLSLSPWSNEIGSEVAVKFTPTNYPVELKDVRFFILGDSDTSASTQFEIKIYNDENGYPGTLLNTSTITGNVTQANQWAIIDISDENIIIDDGDFFVSMYWLKAPGASGQNGSQTIGADKTTPIDGRSYIKWGASGSWERMSTIPSGDHDAMIHANAENLIQPQVQVAHIVLTNTSPHTTISAGSTVQVYGTNGVNHVTLESGAVAILKNFPGNNTITIQSDSSLFTVYRSGAYVTFKGTDDTILEIPATTTLQSIIFNDRTYSLSINSNRIMLGEQEIDLTAAAFSMTL